MIENLPFDCLCGILYKTLGKSEEAANAGQRHLSRHREERIN